MKPEDFPEIPSSALIEMAKAVATARQTINSMPKISSSALVEMATTAATTAQRMVDAMPRVPASLLADMARTSEIAHRMTESVRTINDELIRNAVAGHEPGYPALPIGDSHSFESHLGSSSSSRIQTLENRVDQLEEELDRSRSETRSIREILVTGRTFNEGQVTSQDDDLSDDDEKQ